MNVALSELPKFTAAPRNDDGAHLGSGIIIAPSLEYMDHAFADARLTGMSRAPIVEMLIPSTLDTHSPRRELTLPPFSVSIFPTNCRAAATGIRNASVLWTSSSRRWIHTRPTFARVLSAIRP